MFFFEKEYQNDETSKVNLHSSGNIGPAVGVVFE